MSSNSAGDSIFGTLFAAGEVVFAQGDAAGAAYIVQEGEVQVLHTEHGVERLVNRLHRGEIFGEMALFSDETRSATVVVSRPSRLLRLTRDSLLSRLAEDPEVALKLVGVLGDRVDAESERRAASSEPPRSAAAPTSSSEAWYVGMPEATYAPGEDIVREGEYGETLYVILEGAVEVSRDLRGIPHCVAHLGPGQFFGEGALATGAVRSATVRAIEPARIAAVSRDEFLAATSKRPSLALDVLAAMARRLQAMTAAGAGGSADAAQTSVAHSGAVEGGPAGAAAQSAGTPAATAPAGAARPRLAIVSLASCAGCAASLLDDEVVFAEMLDRVDVVFCPLLVDAQDFEAADVVVVEGVVRTVEDEEALRDARSKARLLVAWGSCATQGGVPGMANDSEVEQLIDVSYGHAHDVYSYYLSGSSGTAETAFRDGDLRLLRYARPVHEIVRVDHFVPGCPPNGAALLSLLAGLLGEDAEEPVRAPVCRECDRKPTKDEVSVYSLVPPAGMPAELCMTSAGVPCMGFLTRAGCGAVCTRGGLPCWGCRGATDAVATKVEQGSSLEQVMADSLAKRCRTDEESALEAVRQLRWQGATVLGSMGILARDGSRIR